LFTPIAKETDILTENQELKLSDKYYAGQLSLDYIKVRFRSNKALKLIPAMFNLMTIFG
jgi:hypothetical protein